MSVDPWFEQQYNNRAAVPEHPRWFESWSERSARYRDRHPPITRRYGEGERALLDLFPARQDGAVVHVFLHGGYWQAMDRRSFGFLAEAFNRDGELAVIVGYDLCPAVTLERIVEQAGQALRWLHDHAAELGGDPERIRVTGHSAGAHLLACLLADPAAPPPIAADAISGLYDLRPLRYTGVNAVLGLDEARAQALSPLFRQPVQGLETPLRLHVGGLESDEYRRQSLALQQAWSGHLPVEFIEHPGAHHFSILNAFLESGFSL